MRAVVDTKVLVSAALNPNGTPARVIDAVLDGGLQTVVSRDVLSEYTMVLNRSHFGFPPALVTRFVNGFTELGLLLAPESLDTSRLPDPADAPFIALALLARCPIITGNVRHFPHELGVRAMTPGVASALRWKSTVTHHRPRS